jgi:hypothetical protein
MTYASIKLLHKCQNHALSKLYIKILFKGFYTANFSNQQRQYTNNFLYVSWRSGPIDCTTTPHYKLELRFRHRASTWRLADFLYRCYRKCPSVSDWREHLHKYPTDSKKCTLQDLIEYVKNIMKQEKNT